MSRLTDNLEALEYKLNKCRGDDADSLLERRLVLREAMESWGGERYKDGHYDGGRDERDARREAQRRADEAAEATEDDSVAVAREDLRAVISEAIPSDIRKRFREALGEDSGD